MEGLEEYFKDFVIEASEHIEKIEFNILELEVDSENTVIINDVYRSMHSLKGLAGFIGEYSIENIAHKTEDVLSEVRSGDKSVNRVFIDKVLKSVDYIKGIMSDRTLVENEEFLREVEAHLRSLGTVFEDYKIGDILEKGSGLTKAQIADLVEKQQSLYKNKRLGEIAIQEKLIKTEDMVKALREQKDRKQDQFDSDFVRVPLNKIDKIIELIGELMVQNSQISENASKEEQKRVYMEKLIKDIQEHSMSLRMTSLKNTFNKLIRVVRNASELTDKEVKIDFYGENIELDKHIVDKLLEPLSHLVKNCIAHGIENTNERLKFNKNKVGLIEVKVKSKRGEVEILVKDDGKGLSKDKILERARKLGFENLDSYSEKEIYQMIFLPGFSTADEIDKVSGRGVGLDVVKTVIENLGGKVNVVSEKHKGTKFFVKIPTNLSVVNGTLVEINDSLYIFPSDNIKEIVSDSLYRIINYKGKEMSLDLRSEIISIIDRSEIFDTGTDSSKIVLIIFYEGEKKAIKVDKVIDKREFIVKKIEDYNHYNKFISGASILRDGRVSLIIDVEKIFKKENKWQ